MTEIKPIKIDQTGGYPVEIALPSDEELQRYARLLRVLEPGIDPGCLNRKKLLEIYLGDYIESHSG